MQVVSLSLRRWTLLLTSLLVASACSDEPNQPLADALTPVDARPDARSDARPAADVSTLPDAGAPAQLKVLDDLMNAFMLDNGIKAGALAVMRNGVVVYDRGFGWTDEKLSSPATSNVMMRLASVSKPLTAAVIRSLITGGKLGLDDHAFDVGQKGGGLLKLKPFPSLGDARLADVTVRHLLQHRGGWDRDVVGDLTYREVKIAQAMGLSSPPGRAQTVRYILGQPLQHKPGAKAAYANIGYLVLGLIIEQATGSVYMTALQQRVLGPLGLAKGAVLQGRTFPKDRSPREPWYDYAGLATNVFDPTGPKVRRPDGGWHHEARVANGGLVSSARPLLSYLQTHLVSGDDIGAKRTGKEGKTWRRNHTGSLAGTTALARQRGDGINYVVLFNKRPKSGASYSSQIRAKLDKLLDSGTVIWP